jgi:hypothetical protein
MSILLTKQQGISINGLSFSEIEEAVTTYANKISNREYYPINPARLKISYKDRMLNLRNEINYWLSTHNGQHMFMDYKSYDHFIRIIPNQIISFDYPTLTNLTANWVRHGNENTVESYIRIKRELRVFNYKMSKYESQFSGIFINPYLKINNTYELGQKLNYELKSYLLNQFLDDNNIKFDRNLVNEDRKEKEDIGTRYCFNIIKLQDYINIIAQEANKKLDVTFTVANVIQLIGSYPIDSNPNFTMYEYLSETLTTMHIGKINKRLQDAIQQISDNI